MTPEKKTFLDNDSNVHISYATNLVRARDRSAGNETIANWDATGRGQNIVTVNILKTEPAESENSDPTSSLQLETTLFFNL